jgi:ATP-dependent Zn protease
MDELTSEPTAYHEAGHAVMALALGRPVDRVSIRPGAEMLGVCHFRKAVFRPTEDWLEREILIALAGLAAEARHTGAYAWDEAGRDRQYVADLALQRAGNAKQAERLERRLLAKAEHVLNQAGNWRAVERLAAELLRRGEISGRTARHLYDECQRDEQK